MLRSAYKVESHGRVTALIRARFDTPHALIVGRAALGLCAVLELRREQRGRCKVAIPGAACHDVLLSVLAAGCEPILCDVDVDNGLVPIHEWTKARSLGADVAIVVHLYGNPADVQEVRKVFPSPECLLVDDAAQALGSTNAGWLCGGLGDVGLLSFGYSKHVSVGNACLLIRDTALSVAVEERLATWGSLDLKSRDPSSIVRFRTKFDAARARLLCAELPNVSGFRGLLENERELLEVPLRCDLLETLHDALEGYDATARTRVDKAQLWRESLRDTDLVPVGMGDGCVPWRYVCRLPGSSWRAQSDVADDLRQAGIQVSNWYFPLSWFAGLDLGALPGAERLSREVFQLWVDENTTAESIRDGARAIRDRLERRMERDSQ